MKRTLIFILVLFITLVPSGYTFADENSDSVTDVPTDSDTSLLPDTSQQSGRRDVITVCGNTDIIYNSETDTLRTDSDSYSTKVNTGPGRYVLYKLSLSKYNKARRLVSASFTFFSAADYTFTTDVYTVPNGIWLTGSDIPRNDEYYNAIKSAVADNSNFISKASFAGVGTSDTIDITSLVNTALEADEQYITLAVVYNSTRGFFRAEYTTPSLRPYATVVYGVLESDITEEEVSELISKKISSDAHPYIYASSDDFDRVRTLAFGGDQRITDVYRKLRLEADEILAKNVLYIDPSGNPLSKADEAERRISTLAMMYQIEGDEECALRAWEEMENIINLEYWPKTMLSRSSLARAVAVGYDWLYPYLTVAQRTSCAEAIKTKALDTVEDIYRNPGNYNSWDNPTGTIQTGAFFSFNNHSSHNNAFFAVAALAVSDVYPELGAYILSNATNILKDFVSRCGPDGAFYEGSGYWGYYIPPLAKYMSSLSSAFGTMFDFDKNDIVLKSSYFILHTKTSQGSMIYGDVFPNVNVRNEELYFIGKAFNDKNLKKICLDSGFGKLLFALWYNGDDCSDTVITMDKDKYYSGAEIATMRNTWDTPYEIFGAMKVSKASFSHNDASSGIFFFDALGERWTNGGLGAENYNLDGYFKYAPDGKRWQYYARRAEANNCLVINPDESPGQDTTSMPTIGQFRSSNGNSIAITDLSEVYAQNVKSYKRGITLTNSRTRFIVQDEAVMNSASEVWWFMNTEADITISSDGKSAILTKNGKKLYMYFNCNADYTLSVMDSVPLPTSPNPEGQKVFADVKKVALHIENVSELNLSCEMIPLWSSWEVPQDLYSFVPMEQWSDDNTPCDASISYLTDGGTGYPTSTYTNSLYAGSLMPQEYYRMESSDNFSAFYIKDTAVQNAVKAVLTFNAVSGGKSVYSSLNAYKLNSGIRFESLTFATSPVNSDTSVLHTVDEQNSYTFASTEFSKLSYDISDFLPEVSGEYSLALSLKASSADSFTVASHRNSEAHMRPQIRYYCEPEQVKSD